MPITQGGLLPPRLGLRAASRERPGPLDGAWWPRSSDLTAEAPSLLAAIWAARDSKPLHMTYDPGIWDSHPARVYVDGHRVKVGWFRTDDPHQVTVALANGTRLIFMVVPSDLDADQTSWAMERSIEPDNVHGPAELLALSRQAGEPL
ncbi:MAG: DUF5994 family protein [Oryzihumus sp.]